jgi:beta-mannosidase
VKVLAVEIASDRHPGRALVSRHSAFESVAHAAPVEGARVTAVPARDSAWSSQVHTLSLDGEWTRRACAEDPKELPVGAAIEDHEWDRVFVPNNFGLEPSLSAHFGPVFYRRRLAPTAAPYCRILFESVDYLADVWLDGEHLGRHEGYFAPFGFDVTGKVRKGSILTVRVQDPFEDLPADRPFVAHAKRVIKGTMKYHDSRPGGLPGAFFTPGWTARLGQSLTTGGITGSVLLEGTGPVRIEALFVTPTRPESGEIHTAAVFFNAAHAPVEALLILKAASPETDPAWGAVVLTLPPGASRIDLRVILSDPVLWWPTSHKDLGTPHLYDLGAQLLVDGVISAERTARFGLRSANVAGDPKRLIVNGRPVFVQAANYIPHQHFSTASSDFYRRDMQLAAGAHLNSLGVHGHVQSPKCYAEADAAGILIFQDFALQWHYDSGTETNPGFIDLACRQIAEMAYTYWNHPSIVYWACHNEPNALFFPGQPADPVHDRDNQVLDAALMERLLSVDAVRHVHCASGIGDDLHLYDGSLNGGTVYGVRGHRSWFVSEYGFWTLGPQVRRWNDQGWPPDEFQMREWLSRLSFGPWTMNFAGLPERYPSLEAWREATEVYGAFLVKYQTEWIRMHRGDPFFAYRFHFFADWWGFAGGGLVDVDRRPKATYSALARASRPLLVTTSLPNTVVPPGSILEFPIHVVHERRREVPLEITWRWRASEHSTVVGVDADVPRRYMVPTPATEGAMIAVPRGSPGKILAEGTIAAVARPESASLVATVRVTLPDVAFMGGLLELAWNDGDCEEQNEFYVLAAPDGWFCGPGAFVVSPSGQVRLGEIRVGVPSPC